MPLIGSFGVYGIPLKSLWRARACFGDCIALLLSLFWEPLWPLWSTLGSLGAHFGTPGSPLRRLRGTGDPFARRGLSSTAPAHKNRGGVPSSVSSGRSGAEQGYILIRNKDLGWVLGLGNISGILENVGDLDSQYFQDSRNS